MKRNALSRYRPYQSEFSHYCATWAVNHGGWRKMKKQNRKISKRRMYREENHEA